LEFFEFTDLRLRLVTPKVEFILDFDRYFRRFISEGRRTGAPLVGAQEVVWLHYTNWKRLRL
jgi:hypothetical protein